MKTLEAILLAAALMLGISACSGSSAPEAKPVNAPPVQALSTRAETGPAPTSRYWAYREDDWYAYQLPSDAKKPGSDLLVVWYMGTFEPPGQHAQEHVWRVAEHPTAPMSLLFFCRDDCSVIKQRSCAKSQRSVDLGVGISEATLIMPGENSVVWRIKQDVVAHRLERARDNDGTTIASALCRF